MSNTFELDRVVGLQQLLQEQGEPGVGGLVGGQVQQEARVSA
jgi:hypothetical protein